MFLAASNPATIGNFILVFGCPRGERNLFGFRQRLNAVPGVGHLVMGINGTARII
jgi:hypothetical protein